MSKEPKFNSDRRFSWQRSMNGPLLLCQDGHLFDTHHRYRGVDGTYQAPKYPEPDLVEPEDEERNAVLARANAKLKGFSEPSDSTDANKEDAKARNAERLA